MAARIVETDMGTKGATVKAMDRLKAHASQKFDKMVFEYWVAVYNTALQLVPVDTGALRASIRIQKAKPTGQVFERAATLDIVETGYYIVAGGNGVINPKHRKEVDYARAVHDGYFRGGTQLAVVIGLKRKKRVGIGRWVPGNPFLTKAIQANAGTLRDLVDKYMKGKQKTWTANQPPVTFSVPTIIRNP